MNHSSLLQPYAGTRVALLTQHGKEEAIAPPLSRVLSAELDVVRDYDTDALGTFTREVPRFGTQLEAARKKATLACERSGLTVGLGSEGSFGPGPYGFVTFNLELLVWVDTTRRIEVVGRAYEPGLHHHALVTTRDELLQATKHARFPDHGLVLRPDGEHDPRVRKGLRSWTELEEAFAEALEVSATGRVFVENDLRAHQHPMRMAVIARAMDDLVSRLSCVCSACGAPGFGRMAAVRGLPCGDCGQPTDLALADDFGCVACSMRERRPRQDVTVAEPARCNFCNP
jgi:hypothetical protein